MKAELKNVRKVNFDVCTVCNHKCTFCPNQDERTAKNVCPATDFETVMRDITSHVSIDELGLTAKGEPLLNPQLGDIVRLAKETFKVPYVYISTNGSLLSPTVLASLLDAGLDSVKFSINAFDRETYFAIHGKDHFERVMNNLANAAEMRRERPFNLLTSSVVDMEQDEIREALRAHIGDHVDQIKYVLRYNKDFRPHEEVPREPGLRYTACPYLFNEIYVDSNCDLLACCIDYFGELRFGNLKEHSIKELWHSSRFEALRKMHVAKRLPNTHLCYRCLTFEQDMFENEKHIDEQLRDKRG